MEGETGGARLLLVRTKRTAGVRLSPANRKYPQDRIVVNEMKMAGMIFSSLRVIWQTRQSWLNIGFDASAGSAAVAFTDRGPGI